jgi:outer membrane lipoprotein SlyB
VQHSRKFSSGSLPVPLSFPRSVAAVMLALVVALALLLSACVEAPPPRHRVARAVPPPTAPAPAEPPPTTQVYVYPTGGQSQDQLGKDRYECHLWAVKQSNFDPSVTALSPRQRVEVVPMPPSGSSTVAGAVTGAIIGAVVARDPGAGAVGGAIVGGAAGAISDSQREAQAKAVQSRYDQRDSARMAKLDEQAGNYRRALTACLEGRGYTVK